MKKLDFNTPTDFQTYFQGKNKELTGAIVQSIGDAVMFQKKTANLFEISFNDSDTIFEINLPKNQWIVALEQCLKDYEEWGMGNEAIDTWQLKSEIAKW